MDNASESSLWTLSKSILMTPEMKQKLIDITGASAITAVESVQSLWSGYGEIVRVFLAGAEQDSVVAKVINFPRPEGDHPRGWDGQFAHERKLKSYQVELHWYRHFAQQCTALCYCPALLWAETNELGMVLVLEDLNKDFPVTPDAISLDEVKVCLQWLANFHATFVHVQPQNLWEIGSYWHLATRPDEYDRMPEGELKSFAQKIDQQLSQAQYQTLIHGDAKLANFCFSEDGRSVAAVDFQYVGQGNGMKDVAYFFSSCYKFSQ